MLSNMFPTKRLNVPLRKVYLFYHLCEPVAAARPPSRTMGGEPSRPGESHPEPFTDPDLNLSIHPARAIARRLPPSIDDSGSSRCRLTRPNGDDLPPWLHGHYPASSL